MHIIDEKFKEVTPSETVKKIQGILHSIGVDVTEKWNDSGLSNCYSLNLHANGGSPFSNGKGVTKEFAQASAYGEFIERLQGGLFFYKNQSFIRNKEVDIHSYAPDVKYMTEEELIENGEWMDYIIESLGNPAVTRKTIAQHCKIYACADDGKILTLPFYSLFENKHVYLPMGFVDQIYATNGCCVGNSRNEAWIHAMSEIMERHYNLKTMTNGQAMPKIPEETLQKYPIVSKVLSEIRQNGDYNVDVFDFSYDTGYPIVSTRIISKKTHKYVAKVAADPVFEIALHRNLTELFQGRNINNVHMSNTGRVLSAPEKGEGLVKNIFNQLETGDGLHTADYFANELCCTRKAAEFVDNSNKNNDELLQYVLNVFKKIGKPVYVRNFSFLGFPCYRFVVPGFSEALIYKLNEIIPQYAFGDDTAKIAKDITKATNDELNMYLFYSNMIKGFVSKYNHFGKISGVPLTGTANFFLANITRIYATYKLGRYSEVVKHINNFINSIANKEDKRYFSCVNKYMEFVCSGIAPEKIRVILPKFTYEEDANRLFGLLDKGLTPFDEYLLHCDLESCTECQYRDCCAYENIKKMTKKAGAVYDEFVKGQNPAEFII